MDRRLAEGEGSIFERSRVKRLTPNQDSRKPSASTSTPPHHLVPGFADHTFCFKNQLECP